MSYFEVNLSKHTQFLGTKEVSEAFMLAVDGFDQDLPSATVLRKRLEGLIAQFVCDCPRMVFTGTPTISALPKSGGYKVGE